jgi:nucleobase:cation symporter-1, NCS1 family
VFRVACRTDSFMEFHRTTHFLGNSGLEVICYVVVWALQLLIIQNGMETVRKFQDWAGPAVWVMTLILAIGLGSAQGVRVEHPNVDDAIDRQSASALSPLVDESRL